MYERAKVAAKKFKTREFKTTQTQKNRFNNHSSSLDQILFLQRTIGNQAVERLIRNVHSPSSVVREQIQAKLKIGKPNDIYEQEADRVAEQVVKSRKQKTEKRIQKQAKNEKMKEENVTPVAPYYVSFQHVWPPAMHHSLSLPGPSGTGADRAGFTRVRVRKRVTIVWGHGPARADGKIPLFAHSVNVFFRLDPIEVFISSDYAVGSCPYRVTLRHEMSHVRAFIRIFHSYRQTLIRRLNLISFPTESTPRWVNPGDLTALQTSLGAPVAQAVKDVASDLKAAMEADRNAKDSPSAYAAVYAQCPASEWNP